MRYILEDGKLNVCLRNLAEWRKFHRKRRDSKDEADERPVVRQNERPVLICSVLFRGIPLDRTPSGQRRSRAILEKRVRQGFVRLTFTRKTPRFARPVEGRSCGWEHQREKTAFETPGGNNTE